MDASNFTSENVLMQNNHMIMYESHKLTESQLRWPTHEKKLRDSQGQINLVSDALIRKEELITFRLLMLVKEKINEVGKNFLNNARKTMKHDEGAVMKNQFFHSRNSKKNPLWGRKIKNLKRKTGLHCFKQTRLYIIEEELRKQLVHAFHDTPLGRHKKVCVMMAELQKKYFWPCMDTDIENYVKTCVKYQI